MQRIAVIDLGTNTFHLLIVEPQSEGGFKELYRERKYIKLAEAGIETIGPAPFQRGLDALKAFRQKLDEHLVSRLRVFGTAALRTASNGADFIRQVESETGIQVQLISGDEEARLIHLGVALAVELGPTKSLIMDIGGGSVEFIIADQDQVYWAQSFPVGVAVLYRAFHHNDPITEVEIQTVRQHLEQQLAPLLEALKSHPVRALIGSSGTFDVLGNMVMGRGAWELSCRLQASQYDGFYQKLLFASLEERLAMKGLPANRADMIVVAIILLKYVIDLASVQEIVVSAYAMKEGMLHEMLAGA